MAHITAAVAHDSRRRVAGRRLERSAATSIACALTLLFGACANQPEEPNLSVWQFDGAGFQAGAASAASPADYYSTGADVEENSTPDGYGEPLSGSEWKPQSGSRWEPTVSYESSYAYRGGRDPRTGVARTQM